MNPGDTALRVELAREEAEILASLAVMGELRPDLPDAAAYHRRVRALMEQGYRLALLKQRDAAVGCAGYRILETLGRGRFLYVDDLVVASSRRSQGFGACLFDWLVEEARRAACTRLDLDSATHRIEAHRFYLRRGMAATGLHFGLVLE